MRQPLLARSLFFIAFLISALPSGTAQAGSAVDFGGTNAYVTFGDPAALDLPVFTIECWFRRDGAGVTASTGTGGLSAAVPLVTKGRGEADGDNRDMNYFFGIQGGVLAADFEEGASGASPGLNHPVQGSTSIVNGVWYHAAVTYDGTTWRLYLNGTPDGSATVGQPPRSDSIQRAAIASALNSTGGASGYFDGVIDEVRIWSYARTQAEIQAGMNSESPSGSGLAAHWSLNEGSGTAVTDSSGNNVTGTILNANYSWTVGAPALTSPPPDAPVLVAPPDGATTAGVSPQLDVIVSDSDTGSLDVAFYGRQTAPSIPDFTIVALPDTQYYSRDYPAVYAAQTQWIVANRQARNIVYVAGLGDIVNDGDTMPYEWDNAEAAWSLLEDPNTTSLADGIPYGVAIGNHDQTPSGDPATLADDDATTGLYNQTFGVSRFQGRGYYGGHFGAGGDNHYELFSASGMDFIAIHLEYDQTDTSLRQAVLAWAEGLLQTHGGRRAIVVSHYLLNPAGTFSNQGQAVYDALKDNPNLFLMLCGHLDQAYHRADVFNGNTIHTLLSDYQTQASGGNGWLRILTFRPSENRIDVETYSPTLGQYMTNASNQFSIDYDMQSFPFALIDTDTGVASGGHATALWGGLEYAKDYEWYVTVSDGTSLVTGPVWTFTTEPDCSNPAPDDATCDGVDEDCDGSYDEDYVPAPTACGLGRCAATGVTSCVAGSVLDSCTPGTPLTGMSLSFDGVSGHVNAGHDASIAGFGASSFTVEAWFYARSAGTYAGIFRHGRQGAASQVAIQMPGSSPYDRLTVSVEDTAGHQVDVTPVAFTLNQWHHVAAVIDRSVNEVRLYLDGSLAGSADGSAWAGNTISSADDVIFGAARLSGGTLSYFLNGMVDEVRIWRSARTQPEILAGMSRELVSGTALAARWGLDEGAGGLAGDSVGANHGALAGGASWIGNSPLGPEQLCDGIDDDCDGAADEDYLTDATCGVGACRTGNTPSSCVAGVETACQPGLPAADDAVCNGMDDDCDGGTDEDVAAVPTACGTGVCASSGLLACVSGAMVDTCAPGMPPGDYGMAFGSGGEHVTFGPAPGLGAATFTLEGWFRKTGPGAATSTGSGGVSAIPLITKGRAEADGSNVDMNYFLGIRQPDGVMAADFEDTATGGNHPVAGTTVLADDTWHHLAAVYDGSEWRLYLDGSLEAALAVGATPRADSIQHAAIATAMTSTGAADGRFEGIADEVRIWSVARTPAEIQASMGMALPSGTGLLARYGFDEGAGTLLLDSSPHGIDGAVSGGIWVRGTPYAPFHEPHTDHALAFDGSAGYVTFGPASGLGSAVFTLETWFHREGAGATANTGTGGVLAVPLLTKGRGEADGSNLDMNWFLGIRGTDSVLVADFEDMASGLNHPVAGTTPVTSGEWHHAAAVYDGNAWRLYLDGLPEASLTVGATPRSDSIQHAALGTALDSSGSPSGYFDGRMDEARVWSVARTGAEIAADRFRALTSAAGLECRWGLDEGAGSIAADSAGGVNGTVMGAAWTSGYPMGELFVAADAVCDGLDEDCDGGVDEEFTPLPTTCGLGECAAAGEETCSAGAPGDTCRPLPARMETCDNLDNDCDGVADNGNPGGGVECGPGNPALCTSMTMQCSGGTLACVAVTGAPPEAGADLGFLNATTLMWTPGNGAFDHHVYRGTVTGAGWSYDHTCLADSVAGGVYPSADEPPAGTAYYYLVSGNNACGEGNLGKAWGGDMRPNASACP